MLPQYAVGLISGQRTILKTESKVFFCQPAYLDSSSLPPAASPRTQLPLQAKAHFCDDDKDDFKDHLQVASHRSVMKRLQPIVVHLV